MPVNQILAPYYAIFKYRTSSAMHNMRVYFETGATLAPGPVLTPNDWTIRGSAAIQDVPISQVATAIFGKAGTSLPAGTILTEIQLWQSQVGSNLFLHNNALPAVTTFGSGTGISSSYSMIVLQAANRKKFRLTYFDGAFVSPQRDAVAQPPTVDDNSLNWYLIRSLVPFSTQDGFRLTAIQSFNTGYNRKLARSYGRSRTP